METKEIENKKRAHAFIDSLFKGVEKRSDIWSLEEKLRQESWVTNADWDYFRKVEDEHLFGSQTDMFK